MYESCDSQFFRATTRIQPELYTFDKSRLVMTILTNVGVTRILCRLRLAVAWKTSKDIPKSLRFDLKKYRDKYDGEFINY